MRGRIQLNLAAFAVLGLIMAAWATTSLLDLDAVERPYHLTAEFTSAPGLYRDLQVAYLGVRVGKVGAVRLQTGKVAVRLDLDRDARIPADATAQVLRKSAIGEPYVELSPGPGTPSSAFLKAGDHIPLGRTSVPLDYNRFFDGLSRTMQAVRPQDARTIVHELAAGLNGRGQSIHDAIGDADRLTATLAANAGLLDKLSTDLARLTHTLAGHRGEIASGANDLAAFTATLRTSRKDLDELLDRGPGFMTRTSRMLTKARPGAGCLFSAVAAPHVPLFTARTQADLLRTLGLVPELQKQMDSVVVRDGNLAYIRVTGLITLDGPTPALEYERPLKPPTSPPVAVCQGTTRARATAGTARQVPSTRSTPSTRSKSDPTVTVQPKAAADHAPSGRPAGSRLLPLLPILVAGAVLLVAIGNVLRVALAHPRRGTAPRNRN